MPQQEFPHWAPFGLVVREMSQRCQGVAEESRTDAVAQFFEATDPFGDEPQVVLSPFAHLGIESHPDDCHACQVAAHGYWVDTPTVDYVPARTSTPAAAPATAPAPAAPLPRATSPRGPPAS